MPCKPWEINLDTPPSSAHPYESWLQFWSSHLASSTTSARISQSAQQIQTPLTLTAWQEALSQYPNQQLVKFFLQGIAEGFRIGYSHHTGGILKSARKNLEGARQHPKVMDEYLSKEMHLKRITGPYPKSKLPHIHINRLGVIPK